MAPLMLRRGRLRILQHRVGQKASSNAFSCAPAALPDGSVLDARRRAALDQQGQYKISHARISSRSSSPHCMIYSFHRRCRQHIWYMLLIKSISSQIKATNHMIIMLEYPQRRWLAIFVHAADRRLSPPTTHQKTERVRSNIIR